MRAIIGTSFSIIALAIPGLLFAAVLDQFGALEWAAIALVIWLLMLVGVAPVFMFAQAIIGRARPNWLPPKRTYRAEWRWRTHHHTRELKLEERNANEDEIRSWIASARATSGRLCVDCGHVEVDFLGGMRSSIVVVGKLPTQNTLERAWGLGFYLVERKPLPEPDAAP